MLTQKVLVLRPCRLNRRGLVALDRELGIVLGGDLSLQSRLPGKLLDRALLRPLLLGCNFRQECRGVFPERQRCSVYADLPIKRVLALLEGMQKGDLALQLRQLGGGDRCEAGCPAVQR
jgi:hypothetical protein